MAGLSLLLLFQRRQSPGTRAHRITVNYGDSLLNALTPRLHTGLHFLFVSTVKILEMAVTTLVAEREIFHCRGAAFGKRLQMFKRRIFACIRNAAEAHDIAAKPAVVPAQNNASLALTLTNFGLWVLSHREFGIGSGKLCSQHNLETVRGTVST